MGMGKKLITLFAFLILVLAFVNCGGFNVDQNAGLDREAFFSSRPVFVAGIDMDPEVQGSAGTPSTDDSSQPRTGGQAGLPGSNVSVTLVCSYGGSMAAGTNAMRVIRENKTVYIGYREDAAQGQSAKLLCATVIDLKKVISDKKITPPNCAELTSATGNPMLEITTNNQPALMTDGGLSGQRFGPAGSLTIVQYNFAEQTTQSILLTYALNDQIPDVPEGFTSTDFGDQSKCDEKASPLFLQLAPKDQIAQQLLLSSPSTGIKFDILGDNASPNAHEKLPISWVLPQSRRDNFFLVLPNSSGAVSGIDEMFGDNTRGPDGKFAANGYEALRKYDGGNKLGGLSSETRDGLIDKNDAIFTRLRLWNDPNGDGIAQPNELQSLSAFGVKSIDLDYDPNYREVDQYGNEVRLKSVVNMEDGDVNLIYDLWFVLKGS
jgi:hypothetical protein